MPYLMRVELPDVPGSLGRVASAIGEAGGDIDAIEIVEKRDGFAVDDVLLETAPGVMPDSVVSACSVLDGVSVLWINRYAAGGNLFLDLEVVESLTEDDVYVECAAPFGDDVVLMGRRGGPEFLDSELARLEHLLGLAITISR